MKNNSLAIELFVNKHMKIIFIFLDIYRYINALTFYRDWNRLSVILIFEE